MADEWGLANELLTDAKLLLDSDRCRSSVSRSYYAAYHACIALLEKLGLKPSNFIGRDRRPAKRWEHGIVVGQMTTDPTMTSLLTSELAAPLRWMYSLRLRGDYRPDLSVSSYSARSSYELAQQIVSKVKEHLT
jgi:uncharacterized protein (UPF0332 family)